MEWDAVQLVEIPVRAALICAGLDALLIVQVLALEAAMVAARPLVLVELLNHLLLLQTLVTVVLLDVYLLVQADV